jgi:hypothetical protein
MSNKRMRPIGVNGYPVFVPCEDAQDVPLFPATPFPVLIDVSSTMGGAKRVIDTSITGSHCQYPHIPFVISVDDLQLLDASNRPDRQFRGEAILHDQRRYICSDRFSGSEWGSLGRGGPALAVLRGVVQLGPRPQGGGPVV